MTPRLVVSDVDGTLVDKDKQLTTGTIAAVARLRAADVGFTIISARPKSGVMPIADALGLDEPIGAFNGGIVFRRSGEVLEHHRIDPTLARDVWAMVGDAAVDRWVFADDRWYASTDQGVHVEHERVASNQQPIVTTDFDALLDRADKITFVSDDPALLGGLHDRAKQWGDRATIVQSQTYYLDVTAVEANKGVGIEELAASFGVSLDDTVAIGDQANDVAMLVRAGLSIAMGNAPDAVKAKADLVTLANDADGVAHAIDHMILKRDTE
ncbi:hydrolase Cof [Sphingomonas sp. Leaf339]|uniref:Cof-type HAD-IIB family hydrolase n=1 Tax=Sphingomonas sp. Leaf339 TaxID=1736343 RepID=UPI0006F72DEF|nr:Cof-type HAD-IIB family hydrolase [Sphingomonas sp. Leaf339]KQU62129.1 hydrolase Cof [Sphingomonas sp. Leaf339]